ncbi:queuosine precursor transporter [Haloterrigena salinisoli]|uniref:queuosine precursor transporter n=1 Tax=Haloterrigena salinisoli TaxID=3132747 RepID=UPI0030CD8B4F
MSHSQSQSRGPPGPTVAQVALIGLFVTALVTAQLTASKVLAFSLPVSLPITGAELALPGAALAYALTFLASDCYAELYGRRATQVIVNVAFAMNFVVLALVWSTIAAPAADSSIDPGTFADVLGASTNIVLGSLLAYVVSQNWDVIVFHRIRDYTGREKLWLRNIASTASSQAIDTVIFVAVAFAVAPALLGVGVVLPLEALLALMVGQYLLKLAIAVLDTPIVYAVVSFVRAREEEAADETTVA